jgi:hypothetical protein
VRPLSLALASAALPALAGCAPLQLSPGGAQVAIVASVPAACRRVGHVEGSAGYNGRGQESNVAAVEVYLRNEAATRGGDRLVYTSRKLGATTTDTLSEPTGAMQSGGCPNCVAYAADAYHCGAAPAPASPSAAPSVVTSAPPPEAPAEASRVAVDAAIAAAAESARGCRVEGGPTGEARVRVTFAATGDVVYTEVENEPFAGTATGDCIARKFRNAHVPPWKGPPESRSAPVRVGE